MLILWLVDFFFKYCFLISYFSDFLLFLISYFFQFHTFSDLVLYRIFFYSFPDFLLFPFSFFFLRFPTFLISKIFWFPTFSNFLLFNFPLFSSFSHFFILTFLISYFFSFKVPQTYFLSTVNFNFDHVSFFGIESVWQRNLWLVTKRVFLLFWWPNQRFLCCTDSVQRTNFNKMTINDKKEDIVKIEIDCTKKISLGYLFSTFYNFLLFPISYFFWFPTFFSDSLLFPISYFFQLPIFHISYFFWFPTFLTSYSFRFPIFFFDFLPFLISYFFWFPTFAKCSVLWILCILANGRYWPSARDC